MNFDVLCNSLKTLWISANDLVISNLSRESGIFPKHPFFSLLSISLLTILLLINSLKLLYLFETKKRCMWARITLVPMSKMIVDNRIALCFLSNFRTIEVTAVSLIKEKLLNYTLNFVIIPKPRIKCFKVYKLGISKYLNLQKQ